MGRKMDNSWSESEMIRAYNEVCHDLRVNWGVTVHLSLYQGSTRYMLAFRLTAMDDGRPEDTRPVAAVQWDYPNAQQSALCAQLFKHSITLARMVEEYRTARLDGAREL